jgi:riboflavin biosynthesis pyrimidine reductase
MRRLLPGVGGSQDAPLDDDGLVEAYRLPAGRSLRANFVASLDGAVAVDGRSRGLGSPGDKRVFDVLRALADVVLVGSGTAATESYGPVRSDSPLGRLRASIGRPPAMPVAVVSRRASLDPTVDLVTAPETPTILVTCGAADPDRRRALAEAGVDVLVCGDDDVDLTVALDRLAELGHEQVLCEGGPELFRAALAAGLVDELDLSIAPALVAGEARLLGSALPDVVRVELGQLLEEDGMLFARYSVVPGAR